MMGDRIGGFIPEGTVVDEGIDLPKLLINKYEAATHTDKGARIMWKEKLKLLVQADKISNKKAIIKYCNDSEWYFVIPKTD